MVGRQFHAAVIALVGLTAPAGALAEPAAARAANSAGEALLEGRRFTEAAIRFQAAIDADPTFARAWYNLAYARRRSEKCSEAVAAYRQFAALQPSEPDPYYGLGLCLKELGDRSAALDALRRYVALERRPEEERWVERARSQIAALESDARATQAPAAPVAPAPPAPVPAPAATPPGPAPAPPAPSEAEALARQHHAAGRSTLAELEAEKALAAHPGQPAMLLIRAAARLERGDAAGARTDYQGALGQPPGDPTALRGLADAHLLEGDRDRAAHYLELFTSAATDAAEVRRARRELKELRAK